MKQTFQTQVEMIIPIRCMNCGNVLADKWRYFQKRVQQLRSGTTDSSVVYMDGSTVPDTAEKKVLDELNLKRYCCRKHLLTHVDLIDKI